MQFPNLFLAHRQNKAATTTTDATTAARPAAPGRAGSAPLRARTASTGSQTAQNPVTDTGATFQTSTNHTGPQK